MIWMTARSVSSFVGRVRVEVRARSSSDGSPVAGIYAQKLPGELLWEEFMSPMGLIRYRLAKEIGVPAPRIGDIVRGRRLITADTDLRLCRFFGLSDGCWLRAQVVYDSEVARCEHVSCIHKLRGSGATPM